MHTLVKSSCNAPPCSLPPEAGHLSQCSSSRKHCPKQHARQPPNVTVEAQRRDALLALVSLQSAVLAAAAAAAPAAQEKDPSFYGTWQYAVPADILPYIKEQAAPGDAQAVLGAMDTFSLYYP